ncbi:nucleotide-diphospho-sugar transferase, partial [Paraphysoderma sedebokerense]
IPNIAHFIILGNTNVTFLQWLSIESADFYLKPSQIYIHADSPIVGKWATKIQRKPNVVVQKPVDKFAVINGHKVVHKAHVSDFIRAKVLYDYGGIYFDLDAIPLKNFTKLRQSGFECIVGEQANSDIGVGLLMAAPKAKLIGDWYESMQKVFDGRWTTHSVTLFTSLLSKYQKDTLILHRKSFFPLSWRTKDLEYLFNEGASEFDWNNSWAMHLYNSAVAKLNLEGYTNITIKGILERKTNFARAVWKVVVNALDKDTISVDDV